VTAANREKINDPAVMRALAHPARLELLEYLTETPEGATATECAGVIGLSPSATSYHLRALAKVGMIKEGAGRGDGRERVWRTSHRTYSIGSDLDATPDEMAAERAMVEAFLARQNEKIRRFLARAHDESPEWFETLMVSDQTLALTADELVALVAKIDELTDPLKRRNRQNPPPGSRPVSLQIRAVPFDEVSAIQGETAP
jgi:DNA-binding transcriptional ArsR family regulator